MLLYTMRHGIAIDREDPACPPDDADRALTAKGEKRTHAVAEGLASIAPKMDIWASSRYRRAEQTARIVAGAYGFAGDLRFPGTLEADANVADLLPSLEAWQADGTHSAIVFGHAPLLDELIAELVAAPLPFTSLTKAGVACLDVASVRRGGAALVWLLTARMLRRLG